jgi:GH18 family chitinase
MTPTPFSPGIGHERDFSRPKHAARRLLPAEAHQQNYDVDNIPASLLTHVYAFAGLQADGACVSVDTSDDNTNLPLLSQLKQQYPHLQILISVGGITGALFSSVAATRRPRRG